MTNPNGGRLSLAHIEFICELIYSKAAIVLCPEKAYLIEARLEPLAKREGFESCAMFVDRLQSAKDGALVNMAVDAMTTNETSFFRDVHPFAALRNHVLPEIIERKAATKKLNVWCAACSSGQEPYTIALVLKEHFPELRDWDMTFLATDLSESMLSQCRAGRFSKLAVNRGLPAPMLVKYFEQDGAEWRVKEEIRSMIDFRPVNLIGKWPAMPMMDVIFIRNVLIYFDMKTKKGILDNVRKTMDPEGYMFLGGAETTLNIDASFYRVRLNKMTCYTLKEKELAETPAHA